MHKNLERALSIEGVSKSSVRQLECRRGSDSEVTLMAANLKRGTSDSQVANGLVSLEKKRKLAQTIRQSPNSNTLGMLRIVYV